LEVSAKKVLDQSKHKRKTNCRPPHKKVDTPTRGNAGEPGNAVKRV